MAFVLVFIGLLMVVTGVRGTYQQFGAQVVSDFTGPGNFLYWVAAIGIVGSLGYVEALRKFSIMFMTLIVIAMFLSNRGFFVKFSEALKSGPVAPAAVKSEQSTGTAPTSSVPGTLDKLKSLLPLLIGG